MAMKYTEEFRRELFSTVATCEKLTSGWAQRILTLSRTAGIGAKRSKSQQSALLVELCLVQ
ncbi:hypothetical protein [Candidatus Halocynthiibacter alkanivorans]|uniref:hypothetical protein n=1 Tax=Candidatus Halocynthiibacter alkanivorans TaxID=2267619 RepID=UPI000DF15663|nr:hypothetical protein [Candidatus Halocynthiibacter alkanivorans]